MQDLRKIDASNMLDILLGLPGQCRHAARIADDFKLPPAYKAASFNKIFITGVGGSGIGGDIVKSYVSRQCKNPVIINRNYDIPAFVDKKTLAVVSSYSGDTEETLSAYSQIKKSGARIIAVTSGGKLEKLCKKDRVPCVTIPKGIPPRTAVGYMAIIPLVLFSRMKFIKAQDSELKEAVGILDELKEEILGPQVARPKNIAKEIASKIYDKFVIIYAAEDFLGGVATRWRQELEENSKILCMERSFPEMNHNEITGWEDVRHISKDFAVIFLRDKDEHPRVSRRIKISEELIRRKTGHVIEAESRGRSLLARMFSLIYTGTFVSFYLAILNDTDPTPVNNVTYLKDRLKEK